MDVFDLVAKISLDDSAFVGGINKVKSVAGTIGKVTAVAVGAATTAVTAFGVASVKTGANFDKSMSQVAATMGKTMSEMENEVGSTTVTLNGQVQEFSGSLRDFAQFMGQNTAFSASQAADALNYMALAGYNTQESMEMLPNVLNLAAAGNMDLARASDMVTDTQTAFGISAERTTQMVDEMAKAASTGNTSVEQLGDAFLTVGGLAQELNGGFVTLDDGTTQAVDGVQELEIALTAMANSGIKGSEAGTHMRNMLLKLSSPTADGTKRLEALGVSVFDAGGNMKSLKDIMGDLNGALGDLTQEEKIQAISDLFNTRDLASAEALLGAVEQDWDDIGEAILNADGAAAQMAETQLDNLAGDVTLFKSALEGLQIAISDSVSPTLREFVQFATDGLTSITTAFQEKGLTGAMEALGESLSQGIVLLMEHLPEMINAGIALLDALGQGIIDNLDVILEAAKTVFFTLVDTLISHLPEILTTGIEIILQLTDALLGALPDLITALTDAIVDSLPMLIDAGIELIAGIVSHLPDIIVALVEAIPRVIQAIIDAFKPIIQEMTQVLHDGWVEFAEGLKTAFDAVWEAVKGALHIEDALNWGSDLIDNFINGVWGAFGRLWDTLCSIANTIADFLAFSEPKKGPLSNFHTYAPDMMDLFAKGIRDNENVVTNQIEKSFNFDDMSPTIKPDVSMPDTAGYGFGGDINVNIYGTENQDVEELSREVIRVINKELKSKRLVYA